MEDNERDDANISGDQKNHKEEGFERRAMAHLKTEAATDGNDCSDEDVADDDYLDAATKGDGNLDDNVADDVKLDAATKGDGNLDDNVANDVKLDAATKRDENLNDNVADDVKLDAATKGDENLDDNVADEEYVEAATKGDENLDDNVADHDYVEAATDDCPDEDFVDDEYVEAATKGDEQLSQSHGITVFQLYLYASYRRSDKIREMIDKNGISINATNSEGKTAHMLATEWNDETAQEILVKNGALTQPPPALISDLLKNEPKQDVCVRQIFEAACLEYSSPEFLSDILNGGGMDINEINEDGQSALMKAVESYVFNAVTVLVAAGAFVSEQVVQRALDLNDFEILESLLQSGPTLCDTLWLELLQLPLCAANRALVEAGQRSKGRCTETPLARAVRLRSVEAVLRLIEAGVDVNLADSDGRTALHAAVIHGYVEMLKVLIGNGAEVNIQDNTSNTPLDLAINSDKFVEEVVQELKLAGAISVSSIQGDQNKNLRDVMTNQETVTKNDLVSHDVQ